MTRETEVSTKPSSIPQPKASQRDGVQLGGVHMPPKAVQHTGAELGGRSLPVKLVRKD